MTIPVFTAGTVLTAAELNTALTDAGALPMTQPNTWADAQTFDGTIIQTPSAGAANSTPMLNASDIHDDFMATPIVLRPPTSATTTATINEAPLVAYLFGQRTVTGISSAYTFPANTDTYISIESGTGAITYNSVANGGVLPTFYSAVPTPPANAKTVLRVSTAPIVSIAPTASNGLLIAGPGGTLAAGTYSVAFVCHDATGYGVLSTVDTVSVPASGLISLNLTNSPPQCTGIDIYVSTVGGGTAALGLVASGVTSAGYIYDGSVAPGAAPPSGSTSMSIQKVSHTLLPPRLTGRYFGLVGDYVTDNSDLLEFALNLDLFGYPSQLALSTPPLYLEEGEFYVSRPITCTASLILKGITNRTWIVGSSANFIATSSTPATDISYPTITDPGPMSGSCFYWVSSGTIIIEDVNFIQFKFCVAMQRASSYPVFNRITYQSCNAFYFAYAGSQSGTFHDVAGKGNSGPITISGSTCFPADSPYVNPYLVGYFGVGKITQDSFMIGGGHANVAFDTWFQDSILQPAVLSYSNLNLPGVLYNFATTSPACTPSGFALFFVAARIGYIGVPGTQSFEIGDIRIAFGGDYGFGMYNSSIVGSTITGYNFEYETLVRSAGWSHFYFASITSLVVENVELNNNETIYPYITYLGGVNAVNPYSTYGLVSVNSTIPPVVYPDGSVSSIITGTASGATSSTSFTIDKKPINYTTESSYISYLFNWNNPININGILLPDNDVIDAYHNSFFLPVMGSTGNWINQAQINNTGTTFTYILKVRVLNTATGEMDYGEFFVQSGAPFSLTTAAAVSNGDNTITTTTNPTLPFGKYSQFSLGGTTVVADSFDNATSTMAVAGIVTGLPTSPLALGATLTYNGSVLEAITPFKRAFVSVSFSSGTLIIQSLLQTTTTLTTTDQQLHVSFSMTNVENRPAIYFSGPPTTPNWSQGAVVYEASPVPGGAIGYVCTIGGVTPTWNAFGIIEPTNTLTISSTTTAGNITITAAQLTGGYFVDSATQTAAFTFTTDTAANILTALPNAAVGTSFRFRFINNDQSATGYNATMAAGTGVTISPILPNPTINKGQWNDFLFIFTNVTPGSAAVTVYEVGGASAGLL